MTPLSNSPLRFNVIVAVDRDFGIGKNGSLPWHLPADLKHFKDITTSSTRAGKTNVVIMGRKTWESLPEKFRPLPGRINVVLTRQNHYSLPSGVLNFASLDQALRNLKTQVPVLGNVFVIGGAEVFKEALKHPSCDVLYLTQIEQSFNCDTFCFIDLSQFILKCQGTLNQERDIRFSFLEYQKK